MKLLNKCVALLISPKVTVKVLEVYIQCCLSDFFKVFCYSLWPFCSLTVCCLFVKKIYTQFKKKSIFKFEYILLYKSLHHCVVDIL